MPAGSYDFRTIQGNTMPIHLRLRDFDATGSGFVFRAVWGPTGASVLRKSTDDGDIAVSVAADPADAAKSITTLTLSLTPVETRAFGIGRVNRYELERRIDGNQVTILKGCIAVEQGVNDDV